MKKKRVLIGFLIILLVMLLRFIYLSYFITSDKMLIRHLFGVNKTDYEIINVDNTLSNYHYRGGYKVKIRVKEKDMESFIKEIEKTVGYPESDYDESDIVVFRNITGREMEENDVMHRTFGSLNRSIINVFATGAKTVGKTVVYSESVDGSYEIYLKYSE